MLDSIREAPGDGSRLRIGVIASELPPEHGGMQEHARGLISCLAADHSVIVYTSAGATEGRAPAGIAVHPVLSWRASRDIPLLEQASVDAWITLNAGAASYSGQLTAPVFAYVHGNDFTLPWLPHPDRAIRLAGEFIGPSVVRGWRQRRIGAGLHAARGVFANSDFSRGLCAQMYGISPSRIRVVPPGMRSEFFRSEDCPPARQLRLVSVSRLAAIAPRKNIDGVIEAVALLRHEIDISYTIIGDGDDLARLETLARELGVSQNVHFLGGVETSRVIDAFCQSDVFIMAVRPSGVDVEGFGMVFAEAAATGLPSIGARIGGIPEVIEDGVTGLLLDDVSASGIADGLRTFHRQRHDFDRDEIRMKAQRFSASNCTAMIAQTIAAAI